MSGATRVVKVIRHAHASDFTFREYTPNLISVRAVQMTNDFEIVTSEGTMRSPLGSWLCIDVDGNLYPCSDSVFRRKYTLTPPPSGAEIGET